MMQIRFVAQQPSSNKPIERFAAPRLNRIAPQEHLTYRLVALACDLHTLTVGQVNLTDHQFVARKCPGLIDRNQRTTPQAFDGRQATDDHPSSSHAARRDGKRDGHRNR